MKPSDWLLISLGPDPSADRVGLLDPVRIQKSLFYFAQERGLPAAEKYHFEPYNYGPCSFDIYRDLEALEAERLVERCPVLGQTWNRYGLTDLGLQKVAKLVESASPKLVEGCRASRRRVTAVSFDQLLKEVYRAYPQYATRSLFSSS